MDERRTAWEAHLDRMDRIEVPDNDDLDELRRWADDNRMNSAYVEALASLELPDSEDDWSDEQYAEAVQAVRQAMLDNLDLPVLDISRHQLYNVLLTCGGPTVRYELEWDPDGRYWVQGRFIHTDCDPKECTIDSEQAEVIAEAYEIFPDDE